MICLRQIFSDQTIILMPNNYRFIFNRKTYNEKHVSKGKIQSQPDQDSDQEPVKYPSTAILATNYNFKPLIHFFHLKH
jgi:hypothetical protein